MIAMLGIVAAVVVTGSLTWANPVVSITSSYMWAHFGRGLPSV